MTEVITNQQRQSNASYRTARDSSNCQWILPTLQDGLATSSPYPTLTMPGRLHTPSNQSALPLLSPSALEANPSLKAPFPPSTPAPIYSQPEASTSKTLIPTESYRPDVCIECMMRDRDMDDVDVTSPGVWSRVSDADYYEALAQEQEMEDSSTENHRTSWNALQGSSSIHSLHGTNSEESGYLADGTSSLEFQKRTRRKKTRIGKGHALTAPSLKLWTSMHGSSSSHRWRTLHSYLNEQAQLTEPELHSRKRSSNTLPVPPSSPSTAVRAPPPKSTSLPMSNSRSRSSQIVPTGIIVEQIDGVQDDKDARTRARQLEKQTLRHSQAGGVYMSPSNNFSEWSLQLPSNRNSAASTRYLQERRLSGPTAMRSSSADMLSRTSTREMRSPSPGRNSIAWSDRPKSIWSMSSKRSRFFGSGNPSSASLLPSGSMLDMHLGLDVDRAFAESHHLSPTSPSHNLPSPAVTDVETTSSAKRKKKGLKKLFSKFFESAPASPSMPTEKELLHPGSGYRWPSAHEDEVDDNAPLEPPYPSYFFDSQRKVTQHDRSASTSSSQSSLPQSNREPVTPPPLNHSDFTTPHQDSLATSDSPKIPFSSLQLQPLEMVDSKDSERGVFPLQIHSAEKDLFLRQEKSLPALPARRSDSSCSHEEQFPPQYPSVSLNRPRSHPTFTAVQQELGNALSWQASDQEAIGNGSIKKAKAKTKFTIFPHALKKSIRMSSGTTQPAV